MFFGGEAFPYLWVGWGPDQLAAFLGAELVLAPETDTSWAQPSINDWMNLDHLTIDNNKWWLGVLEFCRTAAKMGEGKFLVSHLDLHSNLDCISALRGAANLCLDLIENPDKVLQAVNWVNELYKPVYDAVFDAGNMDKYGSITWLELWCDSKTHVPSCDFCSFISPEHFRRFVLPSIEYEVSCLDTAVYHLDGPGQLPHLDDILSIPKLHGIQWVPGAGAAPMPDWLDILKKIQSAGKIVHIGVTPEELKVLHGELEPNKVFYQVWGCSSETDARELIAWLENHT